MRVFTAMGVMGVGRTVDALLQSGARRATYYLAHNEVVSACRPMYHGNVGNVRDTRATIVVKIGAPNYQERKFIELCQRAGELFPVKKIQLKFPPKRK